MDHYKFIVRLRILLVLPVTLLAGLLWMTPVRAATLVVTNTSDTGPGSLRDALTNASPGDTITFAPALSGGTIYLVSQLTLSKNVTIDGSALASPITISGDTDNDGVGNVRVFNVAAGVTAALESLTIAKGVAAPTGGGILNRGVLTVINSTLSGNAASSDGGGIYNTGTLTIIQSTFSGNSGMGAGFGGGIANTGAGTLTITNSTFVGNSANIGFGGGIYHVGDTVTITNSTFSGNSADQGGGILVAFGTLTVTNSTFSGNSASAGGGILNRNGGTLHFTNTIVANSTAGGDCSNVATIATNANNLVEDGSCAAALSGDPLLGPLQDNGGRTLTFGLLTGSPAINAGTMTGAPATDQRGVSRPQAGMVDIGAYERVFAQPGPNFVVTRTADTDGGVCGEGYCTLREAVNAANAAGGPSDTITFAAGLSGRTIFLGSTLTLSQDVTIDGSALAAPITISGDRDNNGTGDVRVLEVAGGVTAALNGLTITKAFDEDRGGGIRNAGVLTITSSTVSGNVANYGFMTESFGGGIFNLGTLTIINSTVVGNNANHGGGLYNLWGVVTITNSTFAGNSGDIDGGGVFNYEGTITITNATFSGNSGPFGAGIYNYGTMHYTNTIVANSSTGGDCFNFATIATNANNLVEDDSCAPDLHVDPLLGPLQDNGGRTLTFALLTGSPAINAGTSAGAPATDQRGVARPQAGMVDIGAYEWAPVTTTTGGTPQSTPINTAFAAQLLVTVTESGIPANGVTVTFTAPPSGASGTFPGNLTAVTAVTNASGVATSPTFTANGIAGLYSVVASLGAGSPTASFALTNLMGSQSITFAAITTRTFGAADFSVSPTANSGLPVSLAPDGNCTVTSPSPGTVHITGAGSCTITASQGGDANFNAATSVPQTFTIAKADQAITFAPLGTRLLTSGPFTVNATGGASGNAVTFESQTTGVCTMSGSTVTLIALGTCTIAAKQAGDSDYNLAPEVPRSFLVVADCTVPALPGTLAAGQVALPYALTLTLTNGAMPVSFGLTGALPSGVTFTNGVFSGTPSVHGAFPITVTATDANSCQASTSYNLAIARERRLLIGTAAGASTVRAFNIGSAIVRSEIDAFGGFTGGVAVAQGDVDNNGIADIIAGSGPGAGPAVRIFDGGSLNPGLTFFAFDPAYRGGVTVAAGDITADGVPDVLAAAGCAGPPQVRAFDGRTGALLRSYPLTLPAISCRLNVAAGDVTGDGIADVIVGTGDLGPSVVEVLNGWSGALLREFYPFGTAFTGGVNVAAGDVTGDGLADIVTGAGPGGTPHVRVFDGPTGSQIAGPLGSFHAYVPLFTGGVRVGAGDLNGDGRAEVLTVPAGNGGPHVRVFDGASATEIYGLYGFDPSFGGGLFVTGPTPSARMNVDIAARTTGTGVRIAGWALREIANDTPGTDAIHVWAYPVSGGTPVFVGEAPTRVPRPDLAAAFGGQFLMSGFDFSGTLAAGTYDLVIYVRNSRTHIFDQVRVIRVTVN